MKIIKAIEEKGYFTIAHVGPLNKSVYTFNNEKSFEPFSYEFLDKKDLTKSEKLQILCTQQYMFKNDGIGKLTYSDNELSKLTGLDRRTIAINNNLLSSKGYMTQVAVKTKDAETGLVNKETIYHLNELGQAIVFTIQNHEERLNENEKKLDDTRKDVSILLNEIKGLRKELNELKGIKTTESLPKRLQEKNLEYFDFE